jgi:putative aldouronate transport system substrate-binding protein
MMNLRRTRLLILACALAVVAGGLYAGSKIEQPAAATTALEPVKIEWLGYDTYAVPDENSPYVKMAEKKFNCDFVFWFIDDTKWNELLNVKFAAGEMPDIIKVTKGLATVKRWVDNGILAPMDREKLKKLAPTYYAIIENHPQSENAWPSVSYNGKYYGLPRFSLNGQYPTVVIWNKTWLENVGITKTPETVAEYEEAFTRFRNNDPDKNGKKDTYGLSDFIMPAILGAYGAPAIDDFKTMISSPDYLKYGVKNGKVVLAAIQPEMKEALALLNKWYKAGLIDPEFITSENTGGYWASSQGFFSGKIGITGMGMFYHWRYDLDSRLKDDKGGDQYLEFKKLQPNSTVVMGQAPIGPKGASGTPTWGAVADNFLALTTKGAKNPRILDTFLTMVEASASDEDWNNQMYYGNKGTDYVVTNGIFSGPNVIIPGKDRIAKGLQLFNYFGNLEWDKHRNIVTFDWGDKNNVKKGYVDPIVPVVDSYAKYVNDLSKLTVETYVKIITGEASVDSFDAYVTKFRANGGDAIEKEVNVAYALSKGN